MILTLDTHTWVWAKFEPQKLGPRLMDTLHAAERLLVPSVCIYEIGQKVRIGRWPGMDAVKLDALVAEDASGIGIVPLDAQIARTASLLDWPHRDPFDRIIAATALAMSGPVVSRDGVFEGVQGLQRIWG